MPTQAVRNLHVPLPDPLYNRLREYSAQSKRPATTIAREAIDRWLNEQERLLIKQQISEYAREMAGTEADLDPDLEAAGIECLLQNVP